MKKILFGVTLMLLEMIILFGITFFNNRETTYVVKNIQYLTGYTYYYPSDATGSTNCTGSNKCIDDFTVDDNGWYHYNYNGKDYLVVAAALEYCRDNIGHCGINIEKHGIAKTIKYYKYYDTLELTISGKKYDALVLDACGACMWGRQDTRGEELFDIFVQNKNSKAPISGNSHYTGHEKVDIEHFGTNYSGDFTKGWIYNRFNYKEIVDYNTPDYQVEKNINDVIDEIFNRAKTSYVSIYGYEGGGSSSSGYSAKDCEEMKNVSTNGNYSSWKQGRSPWSAIKLSSASDSTIGQIGCLVTSIAIQLKAMDRTAGIENFNPGTFACYLSQHGMFTSGGLLSGSWNSIIPGVSLTSGKVSGTRENQATQIQSLIDQGCHLVLYAPHGGSSHFVAVSGTTNDNIRLMDPGAGKPLLWGNIYDYNYSTSYRCLKAS